MPPDVRRALGRLAAALAILGTLAVSMELVGRSGRRTLPGLRVERLGRDADALDVLRRAGVSGRVMDWYDRELAVVEVPDEQVRAWLAAPTSAPPGGEGSWLYLAIRANLVRRVVYVVPDERWEAYAAAARQRPDLRPLGRGFVQAVDGVPVISTALRDHPAAPVERPLVFVSGTTRKYFGEEFTERLLADGEGGDLVLVAP